MLRTLCVLIAGSCVGVLSGSSTAQDSVLGPQDPAASPLDLGSLTLYPAALDGHGRSELQPRASSSPASPGGLGTVSALTPTSMGLFGSDDPYYLEAKIGPLGFIDDLDHLDTGLLAEVVVGRRILSFLSLEIASGYFESDGRKGTTKQEVRGIPILARARATFSVLLLDLYGGIGVGGYYVDSEVRDGGVKSDEDDFVFGGDVFLGLGFSFLGFSAAIEGAYFVTDDADYANGSSVNVEGFAGMLSLGFRF